MRHVAAVALGAILLVAPVDGRRPGLSRERTGVGGFGDRGAPDIVLIVTDDQRWDTLWAMPILSERLAGRGVTFPDAFVVNPLCCPSRASILTGNYSHTHLVYRQIPPFGRFEWFHDGSTLATWLHDAGYRTGLFGKYIDGYQHAAVTGYVPPGWDRWVAFVHSAPVDYTLTIDGALHGVRARPGGPRDRGARGRGGRVRPGHHRATVPRARDVGAARTRDPAPGDEDAFADLPPARPPSFDEADVSDKPA